MELQIIWIKILQGMIICLLFIPTILADVDSPNGYRLEDRFRYIATAPKTVRPNQMYRIAVTLYNDPVQDTLVQATLSRNGEQYASGGLVFSHKETRNVEVKVPQVLLDGAHKLQLEGIVKGLPVFTNSTELRFQAKYVSLFIQTDKPVYYPHDLSDQNQADVYFKVIGTDPSLKPVHGDMTIYVKDGRGFTIRRWIDKQLNFGFYQDFFRISYPVNTGTWKLIVSAFGEWYETEFLVKFWYIRRFDVIVNTPISMFTSEWGIVGTVRAQHTSNKDVEGNGTISLRVRETNGTFLKGELLCQIPHVLGLTSFEYSMAKITDEFGDIGGKQIFIKAWVYDYFWMDLQNGTAVTNVYKSGVRINILGKKIRSFKPGVPFTLVLTVEQTDGSQYTSFNNRMVTIQTILECDNTTIQEDKVVIPDTSVIEHIVKPNLNDRKICVRAWHDLTQQTEQIECFAYWSENNRYIAIVTPTLKAQVDTYAIFTVTSSSFFTDEIVYLLMGQGNIISSGTLSMTSSQITFSLALSRDMVPVVRVVVYCSVEGEVLTDAVNLYVNDTRLLGLDLTINAGKDFKGDKIEIIGTGIGGSLITIHGHHREMYLRGGNTFLDAEKITRDLLSYNVGADVDGPHHKIWTYHDERWDGSEFFANPTTGVDHISTFNVSGLVVLSDTNLTVTPESTNCNRTLGLGRCLNGECFDLTRLCDGIVDCSVDGYDEMACDNQPVATPRPHEVRNLHLIRNHFVPTRWIWNATYIKPYGRSEVLLEVPNINVEFMIGGCSMHPDEGLTIVKQPIRYNLSRDFWMTVEAQVIIQRGEQIGIRCTLFNEWDEDMEAVVIFHGGPDYRFVVVEEFGIVSSYAPRTIAGDIQIMVSLEAKTSRYIHFPFVSTLGRGEFEVTISAHSFLRSDTQTLPFEIWYDGYEDDDHIPYLIDLVNQGSIIVPDFEIPTPEQFYIPGQRELLYVPGSNLGVMHLWGNVALPSNLMEPLRVERTVGLPYDSADGYIAEFGLNLISIEYHKTTGSLNVTEEFRIMEYLKRFLTKISAYMDTDGSFRMFRRSDSPCLWLTSIALRYLHDAHTTEWNEYLGIDIDILNLIGLWVANQFKDTRGRFEETAHTVYDRNMAAMTNDTDGITRTWHIATNAHVVTTLSLANRLTGDAQAKADQTRIAAADYLASKINYLEDPYDMAMVAYALHVAGHKDRDVAYWRLKDMRRESEYVYWAAQPIDPNPTKIVDTRVVMMPRDDWMNQGRAVIATSLALVLYLDHNELADSVPIMKWIQTQRCDKLVWASTQDSLLAMKALIQFAYTETNRDFYNMEVTMEATKPMDPAWKHVVQLNRTNFDTMFVYRMEEAWGEIRVSAKGTGYAYLHFTEFYNMEHPHQVGNPSYTPDAFELEFNEILPFGRNASYINQTICLRFNRPDIAVEAGMTVLIVVLPTGFVISRDVIERMHQDKNITGFIRLRVRDGMVNIFFEYVTQKKTCFTLTIERWYPVANVSHTHMTQLMEYSETGLQWNTIWTTYSLFHNNICQVCGSFQCPFCPFYNTASQQKRPSSATLIISVTLALVYKYWNIT